MDCIGLVLTVVAPRSLSVSQVLGYSRKSELERRGLQAAESAEWNRKQAEGVFPATAPPTGQEPFRSESELDIFHSFLNKTMFLFGF